LEQVRQESKLTEKQGMVLCIKLSPSDSPSILLTWQAVSKNNHPVPCDIAKSCFESLVWYGDKKVFRNLS